MLWKNVRRFYVKYFTLLNAPTCQNHPVKIYHRSDVCSILGITWIYSAILAFEGQLAVFNLDGKGPDYRDLLPTPPPPGDVPSCAEGGVLGVLPGTMGCLQATEAIKILLGRRDEGICAGRILIFDALKMKFSEVHLAKSPDREPITSLIDYQGFCGGPQLQPEPKQQQSSPSVPDATNTHSGRTMDEVSTDDLAPLTEAPQFHSITATECLDKLMSGWSPYVLDVRLQTENDIVALPFTDSVVPHRAVRIHDIPQNEDVLVYCKAGTRGKKACQKLIQEGVPPDRLFNLDGGIMGWRKDIDPSMPSY